MSILKVVLVHTIIYYAGLLKQVSNLAYTELNTTTALISWDPPYSLQGVPILAYQIKIDTCQCTSQSFEAENTHFEYLLNDIHPTKVTHHITVKAVNQAGEGEATTLTIGMAGTMFTF